MSEPQQLTNFKHFCYLEKMTAHKRFFYSIILLDSWREQALSPTKYDVGEEDCNSDMNWDPIWYTSKLFTIWYTDYAHFWDIPLLGKNSWRNSMAHMQLKIQLLLTQTLYLALFLRNKLSTFWKPYRKADIWPSQSQGIWLNLNGSRLCASPCQCASNEIL